MKETISVCRVEQGQIVNSASFTGICIRDEEIISASDNGYINFYVGEGDKVSDSGKIYLLNSEPPIEDKTKDTSVINSQLDYSDMRDQVTVFSKNFNESQYNRALYSKRQIGSTIKPFLYYLGLEEGMLVGVNEFGLFELTE